MHWWITCQASSQDRGRGVWVSRKVLLLNLGADAFHIVKNCDRYIFLFVWQYWGLNSWPHGC
jgi:hypothetical protein